MNKHIEPWQRLAGLLLAVAMLAVCLAPAARAEEVGRVEAAEGGSTEAPAAEAEPDAAEAALVQTELQAEATVAGIAQDALQPGEKAGAADAAQADGTQTDPQPGTGNRTADAIQQVSQPDPQPGEADHAADSAQETPLQADPADDGVEQTPKTPSQAGLAGGGEDSAQKTPQADPAGSESAASVDGTESEKALPDKPITTDGTEAIDGAGTQNEEEAPDEPDVPDEPDALAMIEEETAYTAQSPNGAAQVQVTAPAGALPLAAVLTVGEADETQRQRLLDRLPSGQADGGLAFDLRFEAGGQEVEPLLPVKLQLVVNSAEAAAAQSASVYHMDESSGQPQATLLADSASGTVTQDAAAGAVSAELTVESFSVYALLWSSPLGAVTLADTISSDGCLAATYAGTQSVKGWKWYRADALNETYAEVAGATGSALNVAADGGSRKFYKAEAILSDTPPLSALSDALQVVYYDALQNGGFEVPVCNHWNNQLNSGGGELVWQTTGFGPDGDGRDIELLRPSFDRAAAQRAYNIGKDEALPVPEGEQAAELNCEAAGALYQDVLTEPGTSLYWSLYHRARDNAGDMDSGKTDTMYVVIMPTATATNIVTQAQVDRIVASIGGGAVQTDTPYAAAQGATVWRLTDPQQWVLHGGSYTVPQGQYLTRFFFAAGTTASGNNTEGNLLDNVSFSTDRAWHIEYYLNGVLREMQSGTFAKADAGTTVPASGKPKFAQYALVKAALNGTDVTADDPDALALDYGGSNLLQFYYVSAQTLTVAKTFTDGSKEKTAVSAPEGLASVTVWLRQFYEVTEGGQTVNRYVGGETVDGIPNVITVHLTKQADGSWRGTAPGVFYYYTTLECLGEQLLDADGKVIADEADWKTSDTGSADTWEARASWDKTFTFLRGYGTATASAESQTSTSGNRFVFANTGYVLIERTDGQGWVLCVAHLDYTEGQVTAGKAPLTTAELISLKEKIADVCNRTNDTQVDSTKIELVTMASVLPSGATVLYQEDGGVSVTFRGSNVWEQFYYGVFGFDNASLSAVVENHLNTAATMQVRVTKRWVDSGDAARVRPGLVSLTLNDTGDSAKSYSTVLDAGDKVSDEDTSTWRDTVTVSKYRPNGTKRVYALAEDETAVHPYTAAYDRTDPFDQTVSNILPLLNGTLTVTKTVDTASNGANAGTGAAVFSYRVTGLATRLVYYLTLDATGGSGSASLSGLPMDTWRVEELGTAGFTLVKIDNAAVNANAAWADCFIGYDEAGAACTAAKAAFENRANGTKIPLDNGSAENAGWHCENGSWLYTLTRRRDLPGVVGDEPNAE